MNLLEKIKRRLRTMFPQNVKHANCTLRGGVRKIQKDICI